MAEEKGKLYGLLAEFETPAALKKGAAAVRDAGYKKWDCYSPFPVHGIDPAMGIKRTILPLIVFGGGLTGLIVGVTLQWWANAYDWPWLTSGKPFWSLPANIPIAFETTVLFAGITAFLSMWGLNKLPRWWHPLFSKDRFVKATDNGFFIGIEAADGKFDIDKTEALLGGAGATAVETCHIDPDPAKNLIPAGVKRFVVATTLLSLIPFVCVANARSSKSTEPHIHLIPDMDFQFKQKSQTASDVFADGRGTRAPVAGTVAVDDLREDDHFYRGIQRVASDTPGVAPTYKWATTFPTHMEAAFTLDAATMARGRKQFNVYCAPCHGSSGYGNGVIHQRVVNNKLPNRWTPPLSLNEDKVITQPHGQLLSTITNGVRTMAGYGSQIRVADRWAIVLYIRALQRSQRARTDDIPDDKRDAIGDPRERAPAPSDEEAAAAKAIDSGAAAPVDPAAAPPADPAAPPASPPPAAAAPAPAPATP